MYFDRHAHFSRFFRFWLRVYILTPGSRKNARARMDTFRWVIEDQLAAGPRPRTKKRPTSQVPQHTVDAWLKKAKKSFGIRSIICLLDQRQLRLYSGLRTDLVSYYRANGFRAEHIPVCNYRHPALSVRQLKKVWKAYQRMEGPTLIHCSAGIGRTGKAVSYIKRKLETRTRGNRPVDDL
jgi:protein tyrosine phosphatase (PTP) superfamily phosphohydrolase (DUF442 family)